MEYSLQNTQNVIEGLKKYYQLSPISRSSVPGYSQVFRVGSSKSSPDVSISRPIETSTSIFQTGNRLWNIHYQNTQNVIEGLKKYYQLSPISRSSVPGYSQVFRVGSSKSSPDVSISRPIETSTSIFQTGNRLWNIPLPEYSECYEGLKKYYQLSPISRSSVPGYSQVFRVVHQIFS